MDDLDRVQAAEDEAREREESKEPRKIHAEEVFAAAEPPKHSITIIGCIKTETGWYKLGFDEETRRMIPLEVIP